MVQLFAISICVAALALVSMSLAFVFNAFMKSAGNNPEVVEKVQNVLILGAALIESIALLAFVIAILALQKIST